MGNVDEMHFPLTGDLQLLDFIYKSGNIVKIKKQMESQYA